MRFFPNSNGEDNVPQRLREFNKCHNPAGASGGQFCSDGGPGVADKAGAAKAVAGGTGGGTGGTSLAQPIGAIAHVKAIQVETVDEALALMRQGKVVEVKDVRSVHTLLAKLAEMALDAKAKGENAPDYDLCNVTVKGSENLFCAQKLQTEKHPKGVVRIEMPQLSTEPVPGSPADQLPRMKGSKNVDASDAFVDYLEKGGVTVGKPERVPAANLKVTQSQLVGANVAQMMTDPTWDPGQSPIFVSSDGYILDGHHRWAAVVGRDAEDGRLGDSNMNIIRINAPMSKLLYAALDFTQKFGLKGQAAKPRGEVAKKVKEAVALDHLWMLN
jgi:hypothetical protein